MKASNILTIALLLFISQNLFAQCSDFQEGSYTVSDDTDFCEYSLNTLFKAEKDYDQVRLEYNITCFDLIYPYEQIFNGIQAGEYYESYIEEAFAECDCDVVVHIYNITEENGQSKEEFCGTFELNEAINPDEPEFDNALMAVDKGGMLRLNWNTKITNKIEYFDIEYSASGNDYKHLETILAKNTELSYQADFDQATGFYRVISVMSDGSTHATQPVRYLKALEYKLSDRLLTLSEVKQIIVYDFNGRKLLESYASSLDLNQLSQFDGIKLISFGENTIKVL